MVKIVLFFLVVGYFVFYVTAKSRRSKADEIQAKDIKDTKDTRSELMVRCAYCGLCLPHSEALVSAESAQAYCCEAHRAQGMQP